MNTYTFKKDSWHYWLASKGGFDSYHSQDICTYMGYVFITGAILLAAIGFAIYLDASFGAFLGWLFAGFFHGFVSPESLAAVFIAIFLVALVVMIGVIIAYAFVTKKLTPPGFIAVAYISLRNKLCFKIDFE